MHQHLGILLSFKSGQRFQDMAPEQVKGYESDYASYKQQDKMQALDTAYGIFKKLNKDFSTKLEEGTVTYDDYYKFKAWAYNNLIDLRATVDKLDVPEGADAEQVLISKLGRDKNIRPVLNKKFVRERFSPIEGESEVDADLRRQAIEVQNLEVIGRVQAVIQQAMQFGFMDADTKEILLSVLGDKISNEAAFDVVLKAIANDVPVLDIDGNRILHPIYDALLGNIKRHRR